MPSSPAASSAAATPAASPLPSARWAALAVLLLGMLLVTMDTYVVNIALPRIGHELGATTAQVANVLVAYSLAFAAALITCSKLGDRLGQRRMFDGGLAAFALSSCLAGIAPGIGWLMAARVLQGLAAAAIAPQIVTLISRNFPDDRQRATAFAGVGLVLGLATFCGQYLGAMAIDANPFGLGWRLVFFANAPLALATVALSRFLVPASPMRATALDWSGSGLCMLGVALTIYPLLTARVAGWTPLRIGCVLAGLAVLAWFARGQHARTRRNAAPLVDTRVFQAAAMRAGIALAALMYSAVYSFFFCYALLSQIGEARRATEAAAVFIATPLCFMSASVLARRWAARDARRVLMVGAAVSTLSTLVAAGTVLWAPAFRLEYLVVALALVGIGHGMVLTPLLGAVLRGVPTAQAADGSGLYMTMQQLGGGLGVAIVSLLFAWGLQRAEAAGLPLAAAYHWAFALGVTYCTAATIGVFLLLWRGPVGRPQA